MAMDSTKRVMSGTWGELWLDGELVAECYKFQAKVTLNKEEIPQCGVMWTDYKVKSMSGKGSVGLYKVNSRMANKIGNDIRQGKDPRFTIISKLDDPDAYGAERVAIKNVSFDDLTLADWEAAVFGKVECPFTFGDYEYLDRTEA
ncbi:MAG TPA: phage tail tube protein [Clostridiales bacterium]|nr:phage tail tube protein [Clostridiales bacterium]